VRAKYNHWRDVPAASWRWPNFSPEEIACRGTGEIVVDEAALDALQALRTAIGSPIILRSAYRSPAHNKAVGGAPQSKHMRGEAFDVAMSNHDPFRVEQAARRAGFKGFGFYPRSDFMHIDMGPARQWGDPFKLGVTRFSSETPPAREALAGSRTMAGGGLAGLGTAGSAGVEALKSGMAEAQGILEAALPYVDALKWVFMAMALGGAALAIYARYGDWKRGQR
jgi:zinc D-Ala-D-Ala carboxypeptidase